jgi:hypothetical protein
MAEWVTKRAEDAILSIIHWDLEGFFLVPAIAEEA